MKWKNLFMLASAVVAFAACSNDDVLPDGGDDGNKGGNEADAWVSLSIRPTSSTRSLNIPDQENGTAEETDILNVRFIFFDGGTDASVVTDIKDFTSGALEIGTPGQPSGSAGKAFQISSSARAILVVANPSSAFTSSADVAVGKTYQQVNKALAGTVADVTTSGKFMMTNAKGHLEPSTTAGVFDPFTPYPSATTAESNALSIHIDRVAAKVRVYNDIPNTVATVHDFQWVLNVTNKSYYPVSVRTKTQKELNATTAGTFSPIWSDQYGLGSYRVDPNYTAVENTSGNIATYYNTYTASNAPATGAWKTTGQSEYCLENTQNAATNMEGYTTQVLLKVNFAPNNLSLLEDSDLDDFVAPGADWLRISGINYSYASLMEWMHNELTGKYTNPNSDSYTTPITDAFNAYLASTLVGSTAVPLPTKAQFIEDYDDDEDGKVVAAEVKVGVDAIIALFNAKSTVLKAGTFGSVTCYAGGINYYPIIIKHDNDNDSNNNLLGEFGVVRNSVYDVRIGSISNPGSPVIPTPDPTKPDEKDEYHVAVEINVNPWAWYTQTEHL